MGMAKFPRDRPATVIIAEVIQCCCQFMHVYYMYLYIYMYIYMCA